ncbi:ABC transporter substrate-binding protein [Mesorhizobium koreense]|uniref:ABC transporter substrate-binding protein n=1 Tax=Mesorhizobium koreense TaxID=3074855 RepID=UPI00287BB5AA|nr:ABC transporter substrate-binding protein [Mesorhizobium sp. WR6]
MTRRKDNGINRRTLLAAGAAGLGAVALYRPSIARAAEEASVSVGRQPWAAANSPITEYMMQQKLFEKHAAKLGYNLKVDWRDYPSAMPQVEAFVSNNLDLGMWGNTPIIRGIAAKQPWSILNVGEGHLRFVLATRPDSGIRNVQDLKGKTIGALLGGDPYNALSQILLYQLGSGDPKANGIKIVNTPTQAQAATVPTGLDAAVVIYPAFLKAQKDVGTVGIVNSYGYTEDHYKGPEGEGAGILLPSVKKSPFYPDGYYLHRSMWMAQNKLLEKTPKLAVAFMSAQQEALEALVKMDPGDVSQLVKKYWELPPDLGAKVWKDDVLYARKWVWSTRGDVSAVVAASKFMVAGGLIPQPTTWDQINEAISKGAPLMQQAYEASGKVPDESAFTAKDVADVRGLPVWEQSKWPQEN